MIPPTSLLFCRIVSCCHRQVANEKGRKAEIRLVNLLCIVGACLEGVAGLSNWYGVTYLAVFVVGR